MNREHTIAVGQAAAKSEVSTLGFKFHTDDTFGSSMTWTEVLHTPSSTGQGLN